MTLTLDELKRLSDIVKFYITISFNNTAEALGSREADIYFKINFEIEEREKRLVKE